MEGPPDSEVSAEGNDKDSLASLGDAVVGRVQQFEIDAILQLAAGRVVTLQSGHVLGPALARSRYQGGVGQRQHDVLEVRIE